MYAYTYIFESYTAVAMLDANVLSLTLEISVSKLTYVKSAILILVTMAVCRSTSRWDIIEESHLSNIFLSLKEEL